MFWCIFSQSLKKKATTIFREEKRVICVMKLPRKGTKRDNHFLGKLPWLKEPEMFFWQIYLIFHWCTFELTANFSDEGSRMLINLLERSLSQFLRECSLEQKFGGSFHLITLIIFVKLERQFPGPQSSKCLDLMDDVKWAGKKEKNPIKSGKKKTSLLFPFPNYKAFWWDWCGMVFCNSKEKQ